MTKKSFEQQVSEIITPALEAFKTFSPVGQQKALAFIDSVIEDQTDEFCKEYAVRLRNYFAKFAHQAEVKR